MRNTAVILLAALVAATSVRAEERCQFHAGARPAGGIPASPEPCRLVRKLPWQPIALPLPAESVPRIRRVSYQESPVQASSVPKPLPPTGLKKKSSAPDVKSEKLPAPAPKTASEPKSENETGHSLRRLQEIAAAQNPTLAQARSATWQAWGQFVQAGLYPNPQVAYVGQEIGEEGQAGNQGIQVSQRFVRGGKLQLSQDVAAEQRQLATDRLAAQRLRVANAVRREYYLVLAASIRISLARELVDVATKIKEHIDQRERDGQSVELEGVQAKLELQRALLNLKQAEQQEKATWRQLEAVVGKRLDERVAADSLVAKLPQLNWEKLIAGVEENSPLLQQAQTRVRQAQAAIRRAEVQPTPDLFVQLGTAYQTATSTQVANVQVGMPLPVFNRNQGNITSAEANAIAARREVERLSLRIQHRLATAFREYEQSRAQVEQFQEHVLPLTKRTLELSETAFQDGRLPFLQWLTAQRNYTQTRLQYAEALASLWQSVVTLESQLLDDGLAHPAESL